MIPVKCTVNDAKCYIKLTAGTGSKNGIMTTGWANAIATYKIEKDDIVLFKFDKVEEDKIAM